jgi:diaminohydroxyphosphoribosylaminopyrimidine deaminase/5-amino-6-(5-phosphoribosylamino)uracil reductase
MKRALQIAKLGKTVKSNPYVGAILVYHDQVIGEGYHNNFGGPHAEVNCLNSVNKKHIKFIPESTLYVTLEPCCFKGKTGACTDLILKHKIKNVVIGILDPNPKVAGKGKQILEDHGINVEVSELIKECKDLIRPFIATQNNRPYIILKWAMSSNNLIGIAGKRVLISNNQSNVFTHDLRSKVDGILVGSQTAEVDKPSLTTRHVKGKTPRRIVLGSHVKTPELKDYRNDDILIQKKTDLTSIKYNTHLDLDPNDISLGIQSLYNLGINTILVEGGQKVLNSFIKSNFWDEAIIIKSNSKLNINEDEKGIKAPLIHGTVRNKYKLKGNSIYVINKKVLSYCNLNLN